MKVIVLGAGMVGRAMAIDLSQAHQVCCVDIDPKALELLKNHKIDSLAADLTNASKVTELVANFDLVLCAVPGFMGYNTVETSIRAKKNVVDISFMPEDFLKLDPLAKSNGVSVITDCGVAPGMPNLFLGHYNTLIDVSRFYYMVGGLPKVRAYPFQYKAPFSPIDVLEEYTRPARYVENGVVTAKPAMSDPELFHFDGIGHLEGFNTDGLRSLIETMKHIPNMKEKTLRYPGHIALVGALEKSGFFSHSPIPVGGQPIKPMEVTAAILFKEWKLQPNEPEFTVMRIEIEGISKINGSSQRVVCDLYDEYDSTSETWSMARTTGYTATAAVNMLAYGLFKQKGVFPLELVGNNVECFEFILKYLAERGVTYRVEIM
jgi:lysine 6-dehydrogenase